MSEHDDIPPKRESSPVDVEAGEAEAPEVAADPEAAEPDEPTDPGGAPEEEPDEPTDPGVAPVAEQDEPTDPGVAPVADQDEPTDPGSAPVAEQDEPTDPGVAPVAEPERPTDPGVEVQGDNDDFSTGLVAVILLLAMIVFAIQGDHKDKAWVAMTSQVEAWTGLDFSEPKWGMGGEEGE